MKTTFSLFLALKYLKPKRTLLSVVTVISILGIMLGVGVLVVVLSVMSGFDDMWRDKILGFNSHITVERFSLIDEPDLIASQIAAVEGVVAAAPYVENLAVLRAGDRILTPLVRGVDPELAPRISQIPLHMTNGVFSVEEGEAVIGIDLARHLGATVGDTILLYSAQSFADPDEIHLPEEVTVSGIFALGMWEFDVGFVLTSLETARDLNQMDYGVTAIQVMTEDPLRVTPVAWQIREVLPPDYLVRTWEELNRTLFAALRVEKNLMFILLLFIILVAAFSIANTLITMTVEKTREIGLLMAVGFTPGSIMRVFLWQGWIQGVIGTLLGTGTALLFLHYRNDLLRFLDNRFGYELLPKELYHLSEIPASTTVFDVVLVAVWVMVICTLAGLIPAFRVARLDPAQALRYE
jgi:lipoprotein-releasing system permease protein